MPLNSALPGSMETRQVSKPWLRLVLSVVGLTFRQEHRFSRGLPPFHVITITESATAPGFRPTQTLDARAQIKELDL